MAVFTAAAAISVVFFATRVIGNPANAILPIDASEEARAELNAQLGLDRPMSEQFAEFAAGVVHLDFGESYWQSRPALGLVLERLPQTFQLIGVSMLIALSLGLAVGVAAALRPRGMFAKVSSAIAVLGMSVAPFWLGLILIIIFSVELNWLPSSGIGTWQHLVLPAATLALPAAGRLSLIARVTMEEVLQEQYIELAKIGGIPKRRVIGWNALKNILVPYTTLGGYEFARIFAGYSVLVEVVFAYPGIGLLAKQALDRRDLPLVTAVVAVVAVVVALANLLVDIVSARIDPRLAQRSRVRVS